MSLVLGAVILLLILWILGVSKMVIMSVVFFGMLLMVAVCFGVFVFTNIIMIGAKRTDATYSRTEKNYWGSLDRVFYIVDGEEYANIYPGEVAFKDILYKQDATVKVLFTKNRKVVDRNAELCSRIGIVVSTIMLAIGIFLTYSLYFI